jgi:hypothetical protein
MGAVKTLIRLDPVERSLVLWTLLLVSAIRVGLWAVPFDRMRRVLGERGRVPFSVSSQIPVGRLVWAVRAASRRIPGATCLTQSLALYCLLIQAGRAAEVHIGATKDPERGFLAHAWVEHAGRVWLSGRTETARFARLHSWGGPSA